MKYENYDGWVIQKKDMLLIKYVDLIWDKEDNDTITINRWRVYKKQQEEVGKC